MRMLIFGLAWALATWLATKVAAQDFPWVQQMLGDTVSIEAHGNAQAVVTYRNSEGRSSNNGLSTVAVEVGDGIVIVVDVRVTVNDGPQGTEELAEVMPRDGYIAVPDRLHVMDGDEGVFLVMLPMF